VEMEIDDISIQPVKAVKALKFFFGISSVAMRTEVAMRSNRNPSCANDFFFRDWFFVLVIFDFQR
jgi:hypothetical protein